MSLVYLLNQNIQIKDDVRMVSYGQKMFYNSVITFISGSINILLLL